MDGHQPSDRLLEWLNQPDSPEPPFEQPREDLEDPPGAEERQDHDNSLEEARDSVDGIEHVDPLIQNPEDIPPEESDDHLEEAGSSVDGTEYDDVLIPDIAPEEITPESGSASIATASHDGHDEEENPRSGDYMESQYSNVPPGSRPGPPPPPPPIPENPLHDLALMRNLRTRNRKKKPTSRLTYVKILDNAAKVLDHIKHGSVREISRHKKTAITFYDYSEGIISEPRQILTDNDISILGHATPAVKQRLILVEDLSKPTIEALGITFSINPEFFEEHLLNSNYAGARHDEPPARTWKTATFPKSHISFQWIRPVYRLPTYFSHRDLEDLFEDSTEHFTRRGKVTTKVTTNIFRLEWGLWTDPTKTVRMERECGLEEKVSIWKGQLRGRSTEIVIVLLDPLPEIRELHQDWRLNKRDDESIIDEFSMPQASLHESDMMEEGLGGLFLAEPRRVRDGRSISRLWADMVIRRRWRKPVESFDESEDDNDEKELRKVIVKQMAPRQALEVDLNQIFRSTRPTLDFGNQLSQTKSTQTTIRETLERRKGPVGIVGPLLEIIRRDTLTLIQHLRRILDEVDVDILDDTKMEDRLVLWRQIMNRAQRELPELKASLNPLYTFLMTVDPPPASTEQSNELDIIVQNYQGLTNDIDQMIKRLRVTSASLTSNMGLLESRRSIDEAHAVTRLTELAFIFIPLSFSTSVFGMQVEPFSNPVPIWNFFVVALSVTAFAYLMRMTLRSQWLTRFKAELKYDVRKFAEKHGQPVQSRSLSMFLIFQWLAARFSSSIGTVLKWIFTVCVRAGQGLWNLFAFVIKFFLLMGIVSGIPVAVVCSRDLEAGIKVPVSLAMVLLAFFFVGVPFWHKSDPKSRDALPRRLAGASLALPVWTKRMLLVLGAIAILVGVPLVLIWTRSLATGIKGGLSAGIVIMAILTLGALGTWWVGGVRRTRKRARKMVRRRPRRVSRD